MKVISTTTCPACSCHQCELRVYPAGTTFWVCADCGQTFNDENGKLATQCPPGPRMIARIIEDATSHPTLMDFKNFHQAKGHSSVFAVAQIKVAVENNFLKMDADGNLTPTGSGIKIMKQEQRRPTDICPICADTVYLCEVPKHGKLWGCQHHPQIPDDNGKPATPQTCEICGKDALYHYTEANGKLAGISACLVCGSVWERANGTSTLVEHECHACGGKALKIVSEQFGTFWKCTECETSFADHGGKPAIPVPCPACGGKSVTRYTTTDYSRTHFWGCGSCRRIYEDVNGKMGRCFDDINE